MTTPRPSISAVLPAFNEAAIIASVVTRTGEALRANGVTTSEIIVVDDGSSDATSAEATAAAITAGVPVRVVPHARNRGYGAALRTGFEAAKYDAVWLMDSDGQFDPADLSRVLPHYASDTAVYCYRKRRRDTLMRRANHTAFFWLVRILLGPSVHDVNCAFKLFPRPLGVGLEADGAVISTELVLRTRRTGYRVVEVGVPHYPRTSGKATGANPAVVLRAFAELFRLWRRRGGLASAVQPPAA